MKDKSPAVLETTGFDPAAAGWVMAQAPGFGDLIGPLWRRDFDGRPRFGFVVAPKHLNRAGNLHGGMLTAFADMAMALTGRHATGGKSHATMELNIQFIGTARRGEFVEAYCELLRETRSVLFLRTKMYVGERIVVSANGIWKLIGEP
jgi:uncharacterized protein (TIGR00369 family)